MHRLRSILSVILVISMVVPSQVWACACGCGVFDVGTSAMFPTHAGDMAFVEYDYQNQDKNWAGSSPSSADNNTDKRIATDFFTLGYQHMFNRQWGFMAELPYDHRDFKTDVTGNGDVQEFPHSAVGDIRLRALYTGFSGDMSTGLSFGLKLPTGDYTYPNLDPDTELGSGSTDLLLGGYHMGLVPGLQAWDWFANALVDLPVLHDSGYEPGSEVDAVLGTYYNRWRIGGIKIAPLAQVIGSHRWSDSGTFALNPGSGYSRILLAPGVEFDIASVSIYTDVGFPVYQYTTGNQLIASELYKLNVAYHF